MKKISSTKGPLSINVERDLRKNMRAINQRLNENPNLAQLVLINPILVLEDLGITISKEVKNHIMDALRFPPSFVKRRAELSTQLTNELAAMGIHHKLPLTGKQRAKLVFRELNIPPLIKEHATSQSLSVAELRAYKDKHPVLSTLAEFERYAKGALIFYPRSIYEQYKTGEKKLHWVNAIRFKT